MVVTTKATMQLIKNEFDVFEIVNVFDSIIFLMI